MIQIDKITKEYKDFSLNCSLTVKPGKIVGLIGQNGAGKSTTFKAILGLIKISDGNIKIFDKDIVDITNKDKERIGVVLSDSGFSRYITIKDVIPVLDAMYEQFDKQDFINLCERFKLPLNKKLSEFSTGMNAKLKCLIAVSHGADLLILDEPTAGLDVIARDEMLSILREYMEENEQRSILVSSHISSDLEGLCDEIYMIDNGSIILHEETDNLLNDYSIVKLSEDEYKEIDKQYIIKVKKEKYGIKCLTNQRQYYVENYPKYVVEKGSIDELIMMMVKGEEV